MAIGILGSPVNITSASGSYTPAAGSNRIVIFLCAHKAGTGDTLTNVVYNGITRTPTVTIGDSAFENRDGVGICIFKESELPAGASTATATWSGSSFDVSIFCFTIGDVDQSTTVRTSGSVAGVVSSGLSSSIAQTVTVGDFQLGVFAARQNTGGSMVPQNSWTEDFDVTSTGGNNGGHGAGHFTAVGTSSPCQWSDGDNNSSYALATVALIPFSGGGSSIAAIQNYYQSLRASNG